MPGIIIVSSLSTLVLFECEAGEGGKHISKAISFRLKATAGSLAALALFAAISITPRVAGATLLAYYNFDEGSGLVAQSSGTLSANGDLKGSTTPGWTTGISGSALDFSVAGDAWVDVPNNSGFTALSNMTVGFWINASNWDVGAPVPWNLNGNNDGIYWQKSSTDDKTSLRLLDTAPGGSVTLIPLPKIGEWHHVGFTYDGSFIRTYLDGVFQDKSPRIGDLVPSPALGWMSIGAWTIDGVNPCCGFSGLIDELKVYDTVENINSVMGIPLPSTLSLFATGLGILGFIEWRRRRKAAAAA